MLRTKQPGRCILLIQIDDLDRAILAGTRLVDGSSQVKEARSLTEALRRVREGSTSLLVIEQQLGAISAQWLLKRLRQLGHCEDLPVILMAEQPDVKTTIMAKALRIAQVQKRPLDDDGAFKGAL